MRTLFVLFLGLLTTSNLFGQTTVTHNIGTASLVIQGTSTDSYIVTGTTTTNRIIVGAGYNGTITLQNVNITSSGTGTFTAACGNGTNTVTTGSCMAIMGQNRASTAVPTPNLSPVTRVNLILEGNNQLLYTSESEYCAIQVDEGAQLEISAIDPNDNSSGVLTAKATTIIPGSGSISQAGAAIGAIGTSAYNGYQGYSVITGCAGYSTSSGRTTGGNIIISSGTITAYGGHAAGIGGAHYDYYNGVIIVYGGIVEARANFDAAGIGSGCPQGTGIIGCYADNSTLIALPPAQITAYGAGANANGGVGTTQFSSLGLTGAKNITYINDPNKSLITVRTVDFEPNANIYLDLTETTGLVPLFTTLGIGYDLTKVRVGRTNASGLFEFYAELQQNTTFYTDASSSQASTLGRPYLPVVTTVTSPTTVVLPLLSTNISFTDYPSTPLEVGYTVAQAGANAHRIKVEYNDATSMTDVTFQLQSGTGSDFAGLQFFGPDGVTPISTPTTFTNGMVFYIAFPIKLGKPVGVYTDVLLIDGKYGGTQLPGYIRRIGQQRVVINDSPTNTYIKVTASPNQFTVAHPTTNTVTLTLNIDHSGTSVLYDQLDVRAKYLVTTIADYDAALAASPLSGSDWQSLNIPAANNTNATTTVSFSGKAIGTYYIHWYVESGVVYGHSLTVTAPPRTYGGFGPYTLLSPEVTLSLNKTSIDEGGGAATGTATLTARLGGTALAPAGGITVPLTYSGTATHVTDYTATTSITIPAGANSGTISVVALADYLLESSEAITITAPASVTASSITYSIIGSPQSLTIVDKTDGAVIVEKYRPTTPLAATPAAEPSTNGSFRIRFASTSITCTKAVKVDFTVNASSTAVSGVDYVPIGVTSVTIPAGSNGIELPVTVKNNNIVQGTRKLDITITGTTLLP